MIRTFARTAARPVAAAALLAAAACSDPVDIVEPVPPAGGDMFARYVALGNSLTAGYQSGGISDSTQRESYAYLMATQSMETRFAYPALAAPGCPPPIANFQTQSRGPASGTPYTGSTCGLRATSGLTELLNNVAVPGATSLDPFSRTTAASNTLTTLILGGVSQVTKALALDPTFVSLWIGNNDVLAAAVSGVLTAMPGVSPGATPAATFATNFGVIADSLALAPSLEGGVAIGVVNVTAVPVLFPAAALSIPAFRAGFEQFAGTAVTVLPNCVASTSLVSFQIVPQIREYVLNLDPNSPGHPPVISCRKGDFAASPLVGELFILDPEEQATLTALVTAYNTAIEEKAEDLGWAYFDPNPALGLLRQSGAIPLAPNLADPSNPFGTYISLDGVHPRRPAHVLVANGVIAAINATYETSLPAVQ